MDTRNGLQGSLMSSPGHSQALKVMKDEEKKSWDLIANRSWGAGRNSFSLQN